MQHCLITGCSSGIGLCAAETFHARGYRVVATVRNEEDKRHLEQIGIQVVLMDLADENSVTSAFQQALFLLDNRIDALFNNAAYGQPGAVEDLSRQALREQFETNVFGTQQLTNLAIAQMRLQGFGRIVYNSSVLGLVALGYRGAYNASKFAIEALADTLRIELYGSNIHVSLIEPGPITSRFRANAFAKYKQHIDKTRSAHLSIYEATEARLNKVGPAAPFTLPADAVVQKCIHAFESEHPRRRYYVTFPTYLFAYTKRLLPSALLDWLCRKVSDSD
ncbi:MAG TPA: SDR family NAD(P)-dependent oxidoreductase [Methylophaga aminisulfidivorans]|uniref:SDR family NAD(P)-dependent oxidoreductase n=2 Tax=root TaxID=1 RepID=A0A7C1ZR64_9GAMM|nr:SDR family NAD(P)-dependent oxidoreductase [Methylophaga aminisulfidivorans]